MNNPLFPAKKKIIGQLSLSRADLLRMTREQIHAIATNRGVATETADKQPRSRRDVATELVPGKWRVIHTGPNRAERRSRRRAGLNTSGRRNVMWVTQK